MVGGILGVERFSSFGVGVKGSQEPGEGGMYFVCMRAWEWDVFGGDDSVVDGYVFGDVICWESSGDFGGNRESWDPKGRRLVELM